MSPKLHFIHLKNTPIFEQLQLEEALLRTDERSFCITNFGSTRAIVMGISGKTEELIDVQKARHDQVPIIRRFSGGGTVIVDENTLFITFIMAKKDIDILPFPESILQWTAKLYAKAWQIPDFHAKENDYCIGEHKCGGNAQYIRKDRWLHHTSFLWDYNKDNMQYLHMPKKKPRYRGERDHVDFLTRLKGTGLDHNTMIEHLKQTMNVKPLYTTPSTLLPFPEHRNSTTLV